MNRATFALLALLSVGVGAYAVAGYALYPIGRAVHPDMRATFEAHRFLVYAHVFPAALALLVGPVQFSRTARERWPALHRAAGRVYLAVGVGIGGAAGLLAARHAYGGAVTAAGFGLLALAWLFTGWRAYAAARTRDFARHRQWMVRNYALALAAVSLRVELVVGLALGVPFEGLYPTLAWVCWVPNAVAAEWWVTRGGNG